ncbi:MAG TPA: 1,4-alpha-glucan branching protein domain-containing protein [Solirubrobacteraceae bacterium]|nr:1,4-alpha-glucan branching protein domain-containing protein [Solirubrobacteraceae bacterium]
MSAAAAARAGAGAHADPGELAIVLHSHMPYVEGFGTWPFGEEWLWEAIATSYLPLLDILDGGAPVTLSLTPVLCDQLEAPGALGRCAAFLAGIRVESHRRDIAAARGERGVVAALEHSAARYRWARERLAGLGGDLLGALGRHVAWTSAATHAVLPLLATSAGVRLQLRAGLAAHRRRFGDARWRGGLWLPECAHAPWLDALLEEAGVRAVCVDLTDVLAPADQLRPLRSPAGPLLVPIDRATIELVWSDGGYPADGRYRNYHAFTPHRHRAWSNAGAPYDPVRAAHAAREHAADFVARVRARVAAGGLAVCALDTELLGDWWHEGPLWLAAVLEQAAAQGLRIAPLDDALTRHAPAPAPAALPVTSWGTPRDLATWSAPPVAAMAWSARDAELRTVAAARAGGADARAVRELLALQSSDWAFLVTRDLAAPYGRERAARHRAALDRSLAAPGAHAPSLRNLAPHASPAALHEP